MRKTLKKMTELEGKVDYLTKLVETLVETQDENRSKAEIHKKEITARMTAVRNMVVSQPAIKNMPGAEQMFSQMFGLGETKEGD